jgi:hypothetical protein
MAMAFFFMSFAKAFLRAEKREDENGLVSHNEGDDIRSSIFDERVIMTKRMTYVLMKGIVEIGSVFVSTM